MARPRVFVSSTYWDHRHLRADLKAFGHQMGFEMILFEDGVIAQGQEFIDEACCTEVDKCDLLIAIIGRHAGTLAPIAKAAGRWASISRVEVERAEERNINVMAFVENSTWHEYQLWQANRERREHLEKLVWQSVESIDVFEFIDYIARIDSRTARLYQFKDSQELIEVLKTQLASLFQALLRRSAEEQGSTQQRELIEAIREARGITEFLKEQAKERESVKQEILFKRHPVFARLKQMLKSGVCVFFETRDELVALMEVTGYEEVPASEIPSSVSDRYWYFRARVEVRHRTGGKDGESKTGVGGASYIGVAKQLFLRESGTGSGARFVLRALDGKEWKRDWLVDEAPFTVESGTAQRI